MYDYSLFFVGEKRKNGNENSVKSFVGEEAESLFQTPKLRPTDSPQHQTKGKVQRKLMIHS